MTDRAKGILRDSGFVPAVASYYVPMPGIVVCFALTARCLVRLSSSKAVAVLSPIFNDCAVSNVLCFVSAGLWRFWSLVFIVVRLLRL